MDDTSQRRRRRWPITLHQHLGPAQISLAPLNKRWMSEWHRVRQESREWLMPWEATSPSGAPAIGSFAGFVRTMTRLAKRGEALPWLILRQVGHEPVQLVGQITVSGIVGGSASWGQIGYWVSQTQAGQGIAPLATAMACDYCWGELGLHRIEVAIRPENQPSIRVVQKLGFRLEGARRRYLHIDGDWRDHLVYALNAEEVPGGLVARFEQYQQRRLP